MPRVIYRTAELRAKLNLKTTQELSSSSIMQLGRDDASYNDKMVKLENQMKAITKEVQYPSSVNILMGIRWSK